MRAPIEQKKIKDGRCKGCKHCRGLSAGNFSFYACFHKPYRGKWVVEIKDCPMCGAKL